MPGEAVLPPAAAAFHYLLFTPFRYVSPCPSRFRAPLRAGVWYGADTVAAACAEVGYWRCRFVADSDGLQALAGIAHTLFRAAASGLTLDLTAAPLAADTALWMHPDDYQPCRQLARSARAAFSRTVLQWPWPSPASGASLSR